MHREIAYTVRFPEAAAHRAEIEARVPVRDGAAAGGAGAGGTGVGGTGVGGTGFGGAVELMLPVWTPGSYVVREFARQVETLSAATADGEPLAVAKSRKNRWTVEAGGAAEVVVRYRLYAREMSVRASFVDAGFALLNGAATFLTRVDDGLPAAVPHRVALELPAGWTGAFCALPRVVFTEGVGGSEGAGGSEGTGGEGAVFLAADYNALVDAPIYAGDPDVRRFSVAGAQVELVSEGGLGAWDFARAARDVEAIVRAQAALWGGLPFRRFLFLNLITEGAGGLEHADSTVLMTSRWKAGTAKGWREWLGLVSHELFHAWNGKRLRPAELGPFDYESEVTTRSLWFVEGVTSYYDDLVLRRAGLSDDGQYLRRLGETAERIETAPGREVQSLADASYDAWIKFYRRDENSANHTISYYGKGALVAWLLDVRLRRASGGANSLDDLLRLAWERFPEGRGYRPDDLFAFAAELAGDAVGQWLRQTVEGTGGLDYAPALDWLGLRFVEKPRGADDGEGAECGEPGDDDGDPAQRAWAGLKTEVRDGLLTVTEVRRGTPAFAAGVNAGDELLAIDGYRVPPASLPARLAAFRPGQTVELLVARRERLLPLPLTLTAEPSCPWHLEPDPDATPEQRARRARWLDGG
jgi:predicted metalloprotease with PDZ domain